MNKNDAQEHYINLGAPTMSLERFCISVLTDEYFNQKGVYESVLNNTNGLQATRHEALKQLLSSGLEVTKKLSGKPISKSVLLKRVSSYPTDYTIERNAVKTTYENMGDNKFPWLNLIGELVLLDVFEQQDDDKIMDVIDIDNHANDAKQLKRRDKQITEIINIANTFSYEPMSIPEGGKANIRRECLKNSLFTDSGFTHAWKAANKQNKISMADKEKYL
jgi:hypothetical protein